MNDSRKHREVYYLNYLLTLMGLFESLTITKNSGKKSHRTTLKEGPMGFLLKGMMVIRVHSNSP